MAKANKNAQNANKNGNARTANTADKAKPAKGNGAKAKEAHNMRNANNGNRGNQGCANGQGGYAAWQGPTFQVVNPEGEVHQIDTSDRNTPFYGPAWGRVLEAREKGLFVRGYPTHRRVDQADRFSGYSVDLGGVTAFLPARPATSTTPTATLAARGSP